MTDFIYHHKRLVLSIILLLLGGIGGILVLKQDSWITDQTIITDANAEVTELVEEEKKEENGLSESFLENTIVITVDIKGAVKNPNVYQVKEDSRIYEVIALAGGLQETATTKNINLSKKVEDEMVIYIFTEEEYKEKNTCSIKNEYDGEISEELNEKQATITKKEETKKESKISLNKGTLEEFMLLDGIGESKAKSIIKYREEKGSFNEIEELMEVPGIGEVLYEKIKGYLIL